MTLSVAAGARTDESPAVGVAPGAQVLLVARSNAGWALADFIEAYLETARRPDVDVLCDASAINVVPDTAADFVALMLSRVVAAYGKPIFAAPATPACASAAQARTARSSGRRHARSADVRGLLWRCSAARPDRPPDGRRRTRTRRRHQARLPRTDARHRRRHAGKRAGHRRPVCGANGKAPARTSDQLLYVGQQPLCGRRRGPPHQPRQARGCHLHVPNAGARVASRHQISSRHAVLSAGERCHGCRGRLGASCRRRPRALASPPRHAS